MLLVAPRATVCEGGGGHFSQPERFIEFAIRQQSGVGCDLVYDVRDSQTQASVAIDAATKMIDIEGVTALVGPISSGITAPLLSSVTVEKNVLLIATASTSPTFTIMGREGKTKGLFFRTLPADTLQAVARAAIGTGVEELSFYNYGICPNSCLKWVRSCIDSIRVVFLQVDRGPRPV